jgi:hypothetical protein
MVYGFILGVMVAPFSDKYGRRLILNINIVVSVIAYLIFIFWRTLFSF